MSQQALTRYPFRDPLPVPVEQFLRADDALAARTADGGGRPGRARLPCPPPRGPSAEETNRACARAHGCALDELGWISTLFVDPAARGLGIGRALVDTVVDDVRSVGLRPCLEVLPVHSAALGALRVRRMAAGAPAASRVARGRRGRGAARRPGAGAAGLIVSGPRG